MEKIKWAKHGYWSVDDLNNSIVLKIEYTVESTESTILYQDDKVILTLEETDKKKVGYCLKYNPEKVKILSGRFARFLYYPTNEKLKEKDIKILTLYKDVNINLSGSKYNKGIISYNFIMRWDPWEEDES